MGCPMVAPVSVATRAGGPPNEMTCGRRRNRSRSLDAAAPRAGHWVPSARLAPEGGAMPTLLAINVGLPQDVRWRGRTVHTGVWKSPVSDRRMVRRLNIDGDGQGDLAGHGGEQRAVLVYQVDSYRHWEEVFGLDHLEHGAFGENFTVDGLGDDEVCIGDRLRIGGALFEVTQPRVTCYRVGISVNDPRIPALLVSHHRPCFYFRVLEEGDVQAGAEI